MKKVVCGIYKITNKITNKVYIGKSIDINTRFFKGHICSLRNKKHYNKHLQNSWNKYGKNNFILEIIEEVEESQLNIREEYWIAFYKSSDPKYGYNKTLGGDGGRLNEEARKKKSIQCRGSGNSFYGRKQTEYSKLRASETHKNKKISKEHKMIISKTFKGKSLSEEHKKKISQAHLGKKISEETKRKLSKYRTTTSEQEEEIILLLQSNVQKKDIIKKYNISYKIIYRIIRNKNKNI